MLKHYLRVGLRRLSHQKGYAFINVAGLAVGLAFCALIGLYIRDELTYDRMHARGDRVFRLYRASFNPDGSSASNDPWLPIPLGPALQADLPEVEAYVRASGERHFVRSRAEAVEQEVVYADPSVFDVFTFPLVAGDTRTALNDPRSVVLTESAARRYFGAADPMGQRLGVRLNGVFEDFVVTGVARDVPSNSSLKFEVLLPFHTLIAENEWAREEAGNWNMSGFLTYVLLKEGASVEELAAKLPAFRARYYPDEAAQPQDGETPRWPPPQYRLQTLAAIHLDTAVSGGLEAPSDPRYSYILGGIALAVLFIACVNFTTLAVGRSASRAREVGVRKVVGAQRRQLVAQFWGESLLMSFLALVLGVVLVKLFLPVFNDLAGKTLAFDLAGDAGALLGLAALMAVTGLVAGSYPALVLSGIRPVETLKGRFRLGGSGALTRGLVVAQFALSVFLVASTLVMLDQLDYVRTQNLGFDEEQVVVVPTVGLDGPRGIARFREEVAGRHGVAAVTGMSNAFSRGYSRWGFNYQGELKEVYVYRVEADFLDVMGIELVAGRPFNPGLASDSTHAILINETLAHDFGWTDPVGQVLAGATEDPALDPTVIGIVEDFHFVPLHEPVGPMLLTISPDQAVSHLLVHIAPGDVPATLATLDEAWDQVASGGVPFQYTFLDEDLDKQYETEERWSRIVGYAAFFAVFVACLGLFGLTALTVAARTKEVGIRKVLGATAAGVALLLSKDFARLVLVGVVVAVPVAYFAMSRWLEGFAYRVALGPGVFLVAGTLALLVALLTVSTQALRAASTDPVKALRYE